MGENYSKVGSFLFFGFVLFLVGSLIFHCNKRHNQPRTEKQMETTQNNDYSSNKNLEGMINNTNVKKNNYNREDNQNYGNRDDEENRESYDDKEFREIVGKNTWTSAPGVDYEFRVIGTNKKTVTKQSKINNQTNYYSFYQVEIETRAKDKPTTVQCCDFQLLEPDGNYISAAGNYIELEKYLPLQRNSLSMEVGKYESKKMTINFYYKSEGRNIVDEEAKFEKVRYLDDILYFVSSRRDGEAKVELGNIK